MRRTAADVVARFEQRLFVPSGWTYELKTVLHNRRPAPDWLSVIEAAPPGPGTGQVHVLEAYHCFGAGCQGQQRITPVEAFESMCLSGLHRGPASNKGYGIYLADHGRYSMTWGVRTPWPDHHQHVIVCMVRLNGQAGKVERYRSELQSPGAGWADSEYVVTKSQDVWPAYYIEYTCQPVHQDWWWAKHAKEDYVGFVEHGSFGCDKCDPARKRCDCLQLPLVRPEDDL